METPGMSQQSNSQARLALPTTEKASMATHSNSTLKSTAASVCR